MKKTILIAAITVFFLAVPHVLAQTATTQGFTALAPIPGLTDSSRTAVVNSDSLANFLNNLYKYLIGLAAVIAIIEIIWGGLEISTKDSVSKQSDGKNRIYQAILGLILVLLPALVFSIINPSILNLSINLRPLDTKSVSAPVQTTQTQCDNPSFTQVERQNCLTLLNAQQQGLVGMTPAEQEAAKQAAAAVATTAQAQQKACADNGGRVYGPVIGVQNGKCTKSACLEVVTNGFTTCDVLINGSVCVSNSGTICPDPRKK